MTYTFPAEPAPETTLVDKDGKDWKYYDSCGEWHCGDADLSNCISWEDLVTRSGPLTVKEEKDSLSIAQLQETVEDLKAEIEQLEAENVDLASEVQYWQDQAYGFESDKEDLEDKLQTIKSTLNGY